MEGRFSTGQRARLALAASLLACTVSWLLAAAPALAHRHHPPKACGCGPKQRPLHPAAVPGAVFYVGAAKVDVTPTQAQMAEGFYNGGYDIGPAHPATSVARHIYFRVIAVRDQAGRQVVIGALDSQGYSLAYQNGQFGFYDIERYIQDHLGIPVSHIILQATHDHNGPDEIGIWGGVPLDYFRQVTHNMESGIEQAVAREQPASLKLGTTNMTGFSGTFGTNTDSTSTGDNKDYPMDNQLRVLQAIGRSSHRVIATLVNYSTHATIYGPRNQVLPDWPGSTATYLEANEQDMPPTASYGYPGSVAIVTVGAMGHTWPSGIPKSDTNPGVQPVDQEKNLGSDNHGLNNWEADHYGNAVAQKAIDAVASGRGVFLSRSLVGGTMSKLNVENTNPVLLVAGNEPANSTPLGGYKIYRSTAPPWGYGDVFVTDVTTLRVGNIPFYAVPGEPYPSIKFTLDSQVKAPVQFIFGLANDQLGYVEQPADYNGALQCSASDEWFFTISPVFGADVTRIERQNAQSLGFGASGSPLAPYGPGQTPPATNCTSQQLGQSSPPVG